MKSSSCYSGLLQYTAAILLLVSCQMSWAQESAEVSTQTTPEPEVQTPGPEDAAPADSVPAEPTPAESPPVESTPAEPTSSDDGASTGTVAEPVATGSGTSTEPVSLDDLVDMFKKQQKQLDAQNDQIKAQQVMIATLLATQKKSTDEFERAEATIAEQHQAIDDQRKTIQSTLAQVDELSQTKAEQLSDEDVALRARLETLESSIQTSRDSAKTAFDEDSFPGSTSIPGTNAAMRFGGFVKMNIVETFDPLGSLDRFIAGTIPVPQESLAPRTTMTVSQSRLNWDLRDRTKLGIMRAYVEGDFAGDEDGSDDTFRLRHAYGQFRHLLAGKTWSSFMDPDAAPEEIDFEGINGMVNVRQAQIRYFPTVAENWNLIVSLEEPQAEVTDGDGISQWPDVLVSAERTFLDRWQVKASGVVRQLTATWDFDGSSSTETAYGISFSGKTKTHFWSELGLNNFVFQLNLGSGIGHYINDTDTLGGLDAVFSPDGELETLPLFAGYVAYQHWWNEKTRSNFNFSWVNINNLDYQADGAYHRTLRTALNFIWSPVARIDIGGEIIWGQRKDNDGQKANASQIQLSTKYRF